MVDTRAGNVLWEQGRNRVLKVRRLSCMPLQGLGHQQYALCDAYPWVPNYLTFCCACRGTQPTEVLAQDGQAHELVCAWGNEFSHLQAPKKVGPLANLQAIA